MLAAIIVVLVFLASAIPLHFAVSLLGGKSSLLKVLVANLAVGVFALVLKTFFMTWGGLFSFVLMIWVYKEIFSIGFGRALVAWLLQFVIAVLLIVVLIVIGVFIVA